MSYAIKITPTFKRKYKRLSKKYHSLESDIDRLVGQLQSNPRMGVDLGNNVRKVRMAISDKGKGKSGGARIITYAIEIDEDKGTIALLTIYDKNEQSSITKKEIDELVESMDSDY